MSKKQTASDPQKKYWWLLLIVLPIILALIAIIPNLLDKNESPSTHQSPSSIKTQKSNDTHQSTKQGHNISNVQDSTIIINSTLSEDNKESSK